MTNIRRGLSRITVSFNGWLMLAALVISLAVKLYTRDAFDCFLYSSGIVFILWLAWRRGEEKPK